MECYCPSNRYPTQQHIVLPPIHTLLYLRPSTSNSPAKMNSAYYYDPRDPYIPPVSSRQQETPLPSRQYITYPQPRPEDLLPPVIFASKPGSPRLFMQGILDNRRGVASRLVEYRDDLKIFAMNLTSIRLKIMWPDCEDYTVTIDIGPRGARTRADLLIAIAQAYDYFLSAVTNPRAPRATSSGRVSLRNLVPTKLRHCGRDVFQVDVVVVQRSTMQ
ncbi:hypothetical protein BV20DRAFT_1056109 [Pilatotrama ljubarskyi]|nr:hypothetical protein BV20DRAFT_1056109 [Pilatotrama ljubarskyi]